jgi:hypothetical protein
MTTTAHHWDGSGSYAVTIEDDGTVWFENPDTIFRTVTRPLTDAEIDVLEVDGAPWDLDEGYATAYSVDDGEPVLVLGCPIDFGVSADLVIKTAGMDPVAVELIQP